MQTGTIRIKDLTLRAIIGINDWERKKSQDIIINIEMEYNAQKAVETDDIAFALDYKTITKKIISEVGKTKFYLLEKLTAHILRIIMKNNAVLTAAVRVDKPHALRYSESVSFKLSETRKK
ncbi:MAG: FolB domain-containing protein [bacterium]